MENPRDNPSTKNPPGIYVHFGCHTTAPDEWMNFDSSPTMRFERIPILGKLYKKNDYRFPDNVRYGDVTKRLPVEDASCSGVYASHVLEHLSLADFGRALDETLRILAPGGVFRLVVPDLETAARRYVAAVDAQDGDGSHTFMKATLLGAERRPKGIVQRLSASLGGAAHLWMWDRVSMFDALKRHGFVNIRVCSFGDADDPMFALVESEARFEDAVAIEARKNVDTPGV